MNNSAKSRRDELRGDRVAWLRRMVEIRTLEDRVAALFAEGAVHGSTHLCQGQEAVSVGLAAATRADDTVTCTYRGHGTALALGLTTDAVLGELMGRVTGSIGGVGGSMHLSDPDVGLLPTFAIVGAGLPVAVGAALSARTLGRDSIAVAVFGDGATNIGAFHESLNLASVWRLPVVFICENNLYGEYSPIASTTPLTDLARRADAYAMPATIVDGMDVDAVYEAVGAAVAAARAGGGPHLIEAKAYRYSGHSRSDPAKYRPAGELERWLARDPIPRLAERLVAEGALPTDGLDTLRIEIAEQIEACVSRTLAAPCPSLEAMFAHVSAPAPAR